jgi:riboflavin biosynthesis pyrimidine reductase
VIPKLEVLFDQVGGTPVPEYSGDPRWTGLAVNFVESLDGIVALPDAPGESGAVVSGGSRADHFVMGLLRACADAVLIGAGTLRASPRDRWHADAIFPEAADLYARVGGLRPPLYVASNSGNIPPKDLTVVAGTPRQMVDRIRADGHQRILCEGGPGLFSELAAAGLVDEIFLTLSPKLFGRAGARKTLIDKDLGGAPLELRSLRRDGSHLFLRYRKG